MEKTNFTLAELLTMPAFPGQTLLTPELPPEETEILHVSVIEPPAGDFVRYGELVLTTAVGCEAEGTLLEFIRDLGESGAAAVALAFEDPMRRVPEEVLAFARTRRMPLVRLPWALRFADIVEAVLGRIRAAQERAGARYETLQAHLLNTYLSGRGLSRALSLLEAETGCAVRVTDRTGRSLAATASREETEWKLLLPIRVQSREVGALWLAGERATPEYLDTLAGWSPYILTPLLLWLDRAELRFAAQEQLRDELVRALAEGTLADTKENRARARRMGLWPDRPRSCLVGFLSPGEEGGTDMDGLRTLLRTASDAPGAVFDGMIIFYLTPEELPEHAAANVEAALRTAFSGLRVFWGVGGPGLDRAAAYREARQAARQCQAEGGTRIYTRRDTALRNLLVPCLADPAAAALRNELLEPLQAYDREHDSALKKALLCWFDHGGNMCEAARAMHLHRQSLRYRIGKAEELLGISLDDCRAALALELALRLEQMAQALE
ncbi:MAG: PucR family transcriptional regulator ligand-binding domain-containing protein [Clostridiaceae bacterium]|nr:PucR family transcriptional regulator ligand-binding domain-containing protein [Clostridiaceae bacterium]